MSGKQNGTPPVITKEQMIQYLYGELDEPARAQLEERFFADQEQFAALERLEDQLIDDYVSETLSAAERRKFETAYLISARRREKLRFAQDLQRLLPLAPTAAKPSWFRSLWTGWHTSYWQYGWAAVAGIALLLVGVWWSIAPGNHPEQASVAPSPVPSSVAQPSAPPEPEVVPTATPAQMAAAQQPSPTKPTLPTTVILSLVSQAQLRSEEAQKKAYKLVLSPTVKTVILQVPYPPRASYTDYRVAIETASGQTVLTREHLRPVGQKAQLQLSLPAHLLRTEDYLLNLAGRNARQEYEELSDFSFRIVRR